MRIPPALDRAWTWTVRGAFAFMVPLWLIEWSQDYGVLNVCLFLLVLFLLGMARGWPTTDSPQ